MKRATHIPAGGDDALIDRLVIFLCKRHPNKTADNVSFETGVSQTTVQKWLERKSFPSGPILLVLLDSYGPEILAALFEPTPRWVKRAANHSQVAKIESDIKRLQEELAALHTALRT